MNASEAIEAAKAWKKRRAEDNVDCGYGPVGARRRAEIRAAQEPAARAAANAAPVLAEALEEAEARAEKAEAEIALHRGAARADEERLRKAAERAGVICCGIDTPDSLADAVLEARARAEARP